MFPIKINGWILINKNTQYPFKYSHKFTFYTCYFETIQCQINNEHLKVLFYTYATGIL